MLRFSENLQAANIFPIFVICNYCNDDCVGREKPLDMIAIHAGDAIQIELLIMRKKQQCGPRPRGAVRGQSQGAE